MSLDTKEHNVNEERIVLTHRLLTRPRKQEDATSCWLLDADSKEVISSHPSILSAVRESKRIAAYRAARKLDARALLILPAGGAQ